MYLLEFDESTQLQGNLVGTGVPENLSTDAGHLEDVDSVSESVLQEVMFWDIILIS